ncbi:hypothetical protein DPMN_159564 [Dreissena polymorpha]|uniref:Uncharacterized protein n=1 Tax=Dreissena polymorpha TaxID=45954 RepID=A0A9D4ELU7_DREPO|nr:hypothetical protein DPMN_159564 [Dreissena polymorpha]
MVVVLERLLDYPLNDIIKQNGGEQTSLTDGKVCPEGIIHLSIETYAGVSV